MGGSSWRKYTVRRHQRFPAVGGEGTKAILWRNGLIELDLIHMGELSAARHALDHCACEQTLNSLRDPERRLIVPRAPLLPGVRHHISDEEIDFDQERFMANLRAARRGAAGGPSGMTAEHLKVVLESERDSKSLWRMCQEFARGRMLAEILQAVRIGRMTALPGAL